MASLRGIVVFGAVLLGGAAQPALADVKAGVDAWSRGDYAVAVREWRGPAEAGDADAMFNLAQAYRLGRGVPVDEARAETYYARAAAKGHLQAADTYGLMLFQAGRREQALPYVEDAARRGDPRSQYLLGIAYFNGDFVSKDWVRAYALLTLANSAGLPQAGAALAQMDEHVPLAQRQQGTGLAQQMRQDADSARGRELASAELAMGPSAVVTTPVATPTPTPKPTPAPPPVLATSRIPQPIAQVEVSPSIAAARAAVAEATRATGTESPAEAGADFARADAPAPTPQPRPVVIARADPPRAPPVVRTPPPAPAPRPVRAAGSGPWRVQLGAFSVPGNADKLWAELSRRPELAGATKLAIPAGRVTKLQAGGFASQGEAEAACRKLRGAGHECIVTTR
jgi:cell division septation protein DedD